MRIDLYTKAILTIIAVSLAVIALKPLLEPQLIIAQGKLSGIQIAGTAGIGLWLFDGKTGDAWLYNGATGQIGSHFKVTELGQPATK